VVPSLVFPLAPVSRVLPSCVVISMWAGDELHFFLPTKLRGRCGITRNEFGVAQSSVVILRQGEYVAEARD
jgi:hypothetical protein